MNTLSRLNPVKSQRGVPARPIATDRVSAAHRVALDHTAPGHAPRGQGRAVIIVTGGEGRLPGQGTGDGGAADQVCDILCQ